MMVKKGSKKKKVKKVAKRKSVKKSMKKKPVKVSHKKHVKKSKKKSRPKIVMKKTAKQIAGRVRTGTRNFDKLIEGGLKRDSTNLLSGGSGSGKTIFGMQFLMEGLKSGEKCLYISFEEKREAFYQNFKAFKMDLEAEDKKGNFFFLEYSPQKVNTMLEEGGGAIETLVLTKQITRVVIDSISSFTLLFEKDLEKKEAVLALFGLLKSWDCTTVLISDEDSIDEKDSSRMIDQEVDSIIIMHFKRGGGKRQRNLEILKMRGTNHSLLVHPFKIDDNGLSVGAVGHKKK